MSKLLRRYTLISLLNKEIETSWKILDLGCGYNSPLQYLDKKIYKVGFDAYLPYIKRSKKKKIHHKYIAGDLTKKLPFKTDSFDCVLTTEVIEHLNKHDGKRLLQEMERVARQKIILTTPNGFLPTYAGPQDNPEEKHVSEWNTEELKGLGFRVYGLNGLKYLWKIKNGQVVSIFNSTFIMRILVGISELFVYHYPFWAFQLFFVKSKKTKNELSSS